MSAVTRLVALVKANPAVSIAGAGLAGVLVLPAVLGRREEPIEEAAPPAVYGAGYGTGLTMGASTGLESDALASQINEGNNMLLGQLGELREQIARPNAAPPAPPVGAGRGGRQPVRAPLPGAPAKRLAAGRSIGALRAPRRLSQREAGVILMVYGIRGVKPPEAALGSPAELVAWIRRYRARRAS